LSKSEREIESRKKEEGTAGGGMLQRKLEERQTEYLEKLESAFAGDGMMKKSFTALGQKMKDIVPGLSPILETIKESIIFQTLKNMAVPYLLRWKQARLQKKMAKAQARFYMKGGDPDNRFFDLKDRMLGGLSKLGGPIGDTFKAIREVREKGLGIENWHKLGETPYATDQAKALQSFVQNQNDAKTTDQARLENEIRGRKEDLDVAKKLRQEVADISPENRDGGWQENLSIALQDVAAIQKQDRAAQSKIDELEKGKLGLDSTGNIENALTNAIEQGSLKEGTTLEDIYHVTREQIAEQQKLLSGSPPYLRTVAELAMERTDLARQQLDATEKSQEPSPAEKKIGGAFGAMKGKMSGMMSGAVGFLKGIGTAVKGIPGRIGKTIAGLGRGIATMFKALGSIDPASLAMGLAAITGLSINMILLATAVRVVAPALVKIFGGLSKVIGAFASAIRVIGGVIIGIGKVVIEFMTTFVQSIIDLAAVPFWSFVKIAAGFSMLGLSLLAFTGANIFGAVDVIQKLGVAAMGLAALAAFMDKPERLAEGFNILAKSILNFAKSAKGITPGMSASLRDILNTPVGQTALAQGGGTNRLVDLSDTRNALTQEQFGIQGTTTIINNAAVQQEGNKAYIERGVHDLNIYKTTID
jgi:hypothetical protein